MTGDVHAMSHRDRLPQLEGGLFLTDGGIETVLIFHEGLDLPEFAAFDLLKDEEGTEVLRRYYAPSPSWPATASTRTRSWSVGVSAPKTTATTPRSCSRPTPRAITTQVRSLVRRDRRRHGHRHHDDLRRRGEGRGTGGRRLRTACRLSLTVETDGRLPSGQPLGEAIRRWTATPARFRPTT